jgi:hypothetical protein
VTKALRAVALTTALTLAGFTATVGESLQQAETRSTVAFTSTCWLTCISLNPPGVTHYKAFNVTKEACCSGSALSCPPGAIPNTSWGEPATVCAPNVDR